MVSEVFGTMDAKFTPDMIICSVIKAVFLLKNYYYKH